MLVARITDMHVCPMVTPGTPPIPHVGGPIVQPLKPTVLVGGLPPAGMGSQCVCVGPPDSIIATSTFTIGGRPVAKLGDSTVHGGVIVSGCPTVMIGGAGMADAAGAAASMAAEAAATAAATASQAVQQINNLKNERANIQDRLENGNLSSEERAELRNRLNEVNYGLQGT